MKKILIFVLSVFFLTNFATQEVKAQILGNVYARSHVKDHKPVSYQYLREADVMWSKTVWRMIDLRQKMNHALYFPTDQIGSRMSLIDLLMWGIKNQSLTPYNYDQTNEFAAEMTITDVEVKFGAVDEIVQIEDVETGELIEKKVVGTFTTSNVKQYMVKELWFFDKQRSVLEVRIIGFCPIREYYRPEDVEEEDVQRAQLFWIYYPEARKILANHEVFNPFNDAQQLTFDDLFRKRFFSSYIIRESNVYDDRNINEYVQGIEALLEAERIKDNVFNFEQDLWEY